MAPTNYEMALECLHSAELSISATNITKESAAAQTYATLALVDAIRDMQQGIRDTVADEVSDALLDAKAGAK